METAELHDVFSLHLIAVNMSHVSQASLTGSFWHHDVRDPDVQLAFHRRIDRFLNPRGTGCIVLGWFCTPNMVWLSHNTLKHQFMLLVQRIYELRGNLQPQLRGDVSVCFFLVRE